MRRAIRWALVGTVAVVVLVVAAAVAFRFVLDTARVQALVAGAASQALGRPVRFTSLSIAFFPVPGIDLHGLQVDGDPGFGVEPFLRVGRGRLRFGLRQLLAGRVQFVELTLKQPVVTVARDAHGRWNVQSLGTAPDGRTTARPDRGGGGGGGGSPAITALGSRVTIEDGVLVYVAGPTDAPIRYRVEDIDLGLTGIPGGLEFQGGGRVMPGRLELRVTGGRVVLDGGRAPAEAPLAGKLGVESADLRPLIAAIAGPEPGLAGALSGTLDIAGTVSNPTARGELEVRGPTVTREAPGCPEPRQRMLSFEPLRLAVAWQGSRVTARPLSTGLANGTVVARLSALLGGDGRVEVEDLRIKDVPVERVLVDFLCQGYAVSGPIALTGTASLRPSDPVRTLNGRGQLRIGAGKVLGQQALQLLARLAQTGRDLAALLGAEAGAGSPLEFDSITATYQISDGVLTTRDLRYAGRAFQLTASGQIALPTTRLDVDLVLQHGAGSIRGRVTGPASSPSVAVVPSSIIRDFDPGAAERGIRDLLRRFR